MARDHARILCRIWEDPDFRACSPEAQRVYFLLLSQPTLNHAGVIGMTMRRWARCCDKTEAGDLEGALAELEARRFVVIDDETEELLVRSFIRNDGVASQPNVLKTALKEAQAVASARLRAELAAELRRLPAKPEDTPKMRYPDPHAVAADIDPGPVPDPPQRNPSANPSSKGSANPSANPSPTHVERVRGGGRGGGVSSSVGTSVGERAEARGDDSVNKVAQRLARVYTERVPLSKFPAVFAIVKRALAADFTPAAVEAALNRLADNERSVTVDSLRIELTGRPLRAVSGGRQFPAPGYDANGDPLRDPKTGAWMER